LLWRQWTTLGIWCWCLWMYVPFMEIMSHIRWIFLWNMLCNELESIDLLSPKDCTDQSFHVKMQECCVLFYWNMQSLVIGWKSLRKITTKYQYFPSNLPLLRTLPLLRIFSFICHTIQQNFKYIIMLYDYNKMWRFIRSRSFS